MKLALISCTKIKTDFPCIAREMYKKSTLFKKAVKYVEQQNYDDWFVLSAKYGLLRQHQVIEPYDQTLNNMKILERKQWSKLVLNQIEDLQMNISQIDFYAGAKYRENIIPALEEKGIVCGVPLKGLGIGQQLKFYSDNK